MALSAAQAKLAQDITANKFSEPTNPSAQSVGNDAVGRQIQTRYSEAPGVIPLGSNSFLNRRIARLTVDPVPLLHQLQQRCLADGDPSADVGIEMPYTQRSAGSEAATGLGEAGPAYFAAALGTLPAATSAQRVVQTNSSMNTPVARQFLPSTATAVNASPTPEPPASHTDWGAGILRRHLTRTTNHSELIVSADPSKGGLPRRLVARALASNQPLASQESTSGQPQSALVSPLQTKPLPLPQGAALPGEKLATVLAEHNAPGAPVIQPDKSVTEPPVAPSIYLQRPKDTGAPKNRMANTVTSAPIQPSARAPIVQRAQPAVGASDVPGNSATASTPARVLETNAPPTVYSVTVIGTPIVQRRREGADPVHPQEAWQGSPQQEQPLAGTPAQPVGSPSKVLPTNPLAQAALSAPLLTTTLSEGQAQIASVSGPNRPALVSQMTAISMQGASPMTQAGEQRMGLVLRHRKSDTHQIAQTAPATASLQAAPLESSRTPVVTSGRLVQPPSASASARHANVHRSVPATPEVLMPNAFPSLEPLQKTAVESDRFVKESSAKAIHEGDYLHRSVQVKSEVATPSLAQPVSMQLTAAQKFLERSRVENSGQQPGIGAIAPNFELVQKDSVHKALDASAQPEMPLTLSGAGLAQRTGSSGENSPGVMRAQTTSRSNEQERRPHETGSASGAVVPESAHSNLALAQTAQQAPTATVAAQSAPVVALSSAPTLMPVRRLSTNIGPNEPGQAVLQRRSEGATSQRTQTAPEMRSPSLASSSPGYNGSRREGAAPTASESVPKTGEEQPTFPLVQSALPLQEERTAPEARTVQVAQGPPALHTLPVIIRQTATPFVARAAEHALVANKGESAPVLPLVMESQPKVAAPDERPWLNALPVNVLGATFIQRRISGPTEPLLQHWSSAASGNMGRADVGAEPLTWIAPASLIQRALAATLPDHTFASDGGAAIQRQEGDQTPMRQGSPASSSTPAAPTAAQASLTAALANMTTPIASATGVTRQSLDNIDFERLADRVYAIIEQRLIRERESLGL